jgi:tetratricopeptide (TPR) repeat protein
MKAPRRAVALGLLAATLAGSPALTAQEAPARLEIPDPNLVGVDKAVAEEILTQLEALRTLEADAETPGAQLAEAYGSLGEFFFLYEMLLQAEATFENAAALAPSDLRWHYFLGVIAQELRRLEEAREHYATVLALDPRYLPALLRLGELERVALRPEEARQWYSEALTIFPKAPAAHWGLGQIASGQGDAATAVSHFEAVLEMQPQASAVHYPLALAYRDLGETEKARAHIEQRGDVIPVAIDPLISGLTQRVEGASLFMLRGNQAFSRGNFEMASVAYSRAVEADPESITARHALASSLSRAGRWEEAREQLELIVEQDPGNGVAHYNLGTIYSQFGNTDGAQKHFELAVEHNPDLTNAHFNLAILLEEEGQLHRALEHYGEARELDPQDTGAAIRHAALSARLGRPAEAESALRALLTVDPTNAEARLALSGVLAGQGRQDEALGQLREVLDTSQDRQFQARAWFETGQLLLDGGDYPGSIEALRNTVDLMPGVLGARLLLATALGRSGRFIDAADEYDLLIEADPSLFEAHTGRALARLLGGQDARAVQALEESLAQVPEAIELQNLLARILAASESSEVRDGSRALQLAQQAMMRQQSLHIAETLAMALAELGRFEDAVELQGRIHSEASRTGDPDLPSIEARLRLYQQGEPARAPWLPGR